MNYGRRTRSALLLPALMAFASAHAGEVEEHLLRCSALGDASARLGCFDALVKHAAPAPAPAAPANAQPVEVQPAAEISRMTQVWELSDSAKRGRYAFRPYRDNYLLLANDSNATNDQPFRPYRPSSVHTKHVELTYQLSFKVKLLEGIANTPIDLWGAYTQQSFWQAYNRAASSPFRETNYQPEVIAVVPLNLPLAGFKLRYAGLGLVHQSNGQSLTLSRSWNRLYGELGAENGNFGVTARVWKRLDNARSENDNPDIVDFMGHGDLRATYRNHGNEYSMTVRRNFDTHKGALQAGWAFPLRVNLKGYVQLFTGYGQSLIDYNYSQESIGAGVLMDF